MQNGGSNGGSMYGGYQSSGYGQPANNQATNSNAGGYGGGGYGRPVYGQPPAQAQPNNRGEYPNLVFRKAAHTYLGHGSKPVNVSPSKTLYILCRLQNLAH